MIMRIGDSMFQRVYFKGSIDEVHLYQRELSAYEVLDCITLYEVQSHKVPY